MEIAASKILVTGASGGLGAAIARELRGRGANLVLTARRADLLDQLSEELGAEVVVADQRNRDDVARLATVAATCDGLVANAGTDVEPAFLELTDDDIDRVLSVNLRAPLVLARAFAQARLNVGRPGAVVFVGSLSGLSANPGTRLYCSSKFGLRGFSLALAQELHGTSVTCSIIEPGFIRDAGMHHDSGVQLPRYVRKKRPADVAAAVASALTDGKMETFVAPVDLSAGALLATVAPRLSAAILRRVGASDLAAEGQKRATAQRP